MREKLREHKLFFLVLLLLVLILSYAGLSIYNVYSLKRYDEEFLPNTYLERFDMTSYTFEHAHVKIDFYEDYINEKYSTFLYNCGCIVCFYDIRIYNFI